MTPDLASDLDSDWTTGPGKVIIEESLKVLNCDRISLFIYDKRIEMPLWAELVVGASGSRTNPA